jgi:hypothetical protein
MTLPRSAADVLAGHVLFEIEAIDRMYLNLYQPRLQHGAGIAAFFVGPRGHRFASSALMAPMTAAFTADMRTCLAPLLGLDPGAMTSGQLSYDLRRLRIHGLIERIPRTFRYQVTPGGIRRALFLTRLTQQFLIPGLAQLADPSPPAPSDCRPPPAPTTPLSTTSPARPGSPPYLPVLPAETTRHRRT